MHILYRPLRIKLPDITRLLIIFPLFIALLSGTAKAADANLEKSIHNSLQQSKVIIEKIENKLSQGSSISTETIQLEDMAENVRASHMLLEERFRFIDENNILGGKAETRHKIMLESYRKVIEEYLMLIENLSTKEEAIHSQLYHLKILLEKVLHKKLLSQNPVG